MSLMQHGKSLVRWAAAVAAGLAIAAGILGPATPAVAATTPAWRTIVTTKLEFQDVTAIGPRNAWAVAGGPRFTFLFHWNGARWSSQVVPGSGGFTPISVQAPSRSVVWISGVAVNQLGVGQAAVLIETAGSWRKMLLPAQSLIGGTAVVGNAQAWGMDDAGTCSGSAPPVCNTSVWSWDNGAVTSYPMPRTVAAISSAGSSAFVVTSSRAVFRLTSAGPQQLPPAPGPLGQFTQLAASPSGQLWLLAMGVRKANPTDSLYYFNGQRWSRQPVPAARDRLTYTSAGLAYNDHGGVWLGPYTEWTGKAWIRSRPATFNATSELEMVTGIPGSPSAWAVGTNSRPMGSTFRTIIAIDGKLP